MAKPLGDDRRSGRESARKAFLETMVPPCQRGCAGDGAMGPVSEAVSSSQFSRLFDYDVGDRTDSCSRKSKCETETTFQQFVAQSDSHLYDPSQGLAWIIDRADVRLINHTSSLHHLHQTLTASNLVDTQRLRPDWDQYFMKLASLAAQRSNCMKRRVGCVLVREKRVISTGYNGTPRNLKNCNEGGCKSSFAESKRVLAFFDWSQVDDATLAMGEVWICQHVYAFMPKRMHYLKPVGNVSEKAPSFIVVRE